MVEGGKVLIVEAEDLVCEFTARALSEWGYVALEASNVQNSLKLLEREGKDVDLLLCDSMLVDKSGYQLAHEPLGFRPDLRVVLVGDCADNRPISRK